MKGGRPCGESELFMTRRNRIKMTPRSSVRAFTAVPRLSRIRHSQRGFLLTASGFQWAVKSSSSAALAGGSRPIDFRRFPTLQSWPYAFASGPYSRFFSIFLTSLTDRAGSWRYSTGLQLTMGFDHISFEWYGSYGVFRASAGFDWVWLGFTSFYAVSLAYTRFDWVWRGSTEFGWVWVGLSGFEWV